MAASVYGLNVGDLLEEQQRLEWQHWNIFMPVQDGSLLPLDISRYLQSSPHPVAVADVGSGTGVWLKTLSSQLSPNTRLHGFDFDTSKFPKHGLLPPNMQLKYANALEPFSQELHGQYDLVHVRAFVFALRGNDEWEHIMANLASLLKPGGWLLWDETSMSSWVAVPLGEAWSKVIRLVVETSIAKGVDPCAPCRLVDYMKKVGLLEHGEVIKNSLSGVLSSAAVNQFVVDGLRQYAQGIVMLGGTDGVRSENDADVLFAALNKELSEGSKMSMNFSQTWARRPNKTGM